MEKELRIGNYVDLYGSIAQIQRVDFDTSYKNGIAVDEGKPIPLTEQWLIDFGGYYNGNTWQFDFDNGFSEWIFEDGFIIDYGYKLLWDNDYRYEHVHQFQNLIYIITRKELTK